ncbi:MAG: site-specific DNA-methyltransferase [Armatimonadetes bacterium]|nr:site-specific DNA-methyltransferase [Armatimonadota bacterium]
MPCAEGRGLDARLCERHRQERCHGVFGDDGSAPVYLHRVLKPTGSLYLHCDPTASAYLRLILDALFGVRNFRNEIVWQRTATKGDARRKYGAVHDIIFFYTKSSDYTFNPVYMKADDVYTDRFSLNDDDGRGTYRLAPLDSPNHRPNLTYEYKGYAPPAKGWRVSRALMEELDADGRLHFPKSPTGRIARKHYLEEQSGRKVSDVFTDISPLQAVGKERLGYPTQKPVALLERILAASTNEGHTVLDPFAGCGTTITAAQKMGRHWLGIDVTPIATSLIQARLEKSFGARDIRLLSKDDPAQRLAFNVVGLPTDMNGARQLYDKDPLHKDFEMWAVGLVPAIPQAKKGADGGVDGITYTHDNPDKSGKVVVQVKGGKVGESQIRDLFGTMTKENAVMGFFVTLEPPTKNMTDTAIKYGFYKSKSGVGKPVPVIQIRTIEQLLGGDNFVGPISGGIGAYKDAQRITVDPKQAALEV